MADDAVTLTFADATDGRVIESDEGKVAQVLRNDITNALTVSEQGSATVSARVDDAGMLHLAVRDTGIGIAPQHLERVFDPFWQVEQRKTRTAGGSGLGLTVARRLARLMGGDVSGTSVPGRGSRFVFSVPRVGARGRGDRGLLRLRIERNGGKRNGGER